MERARDQQQHREGCCGPDVRQSDNVCLLLRRLLWVSFQTTSAKLSSTRLKAMNEKRRISKVTTTEERMVGRSNCFPRIDERNPSITPVMGFTANNHFQFGGTILAG